MFIVGVIVGVCLGYNLKIQCKTQSLILIIGAKEFNKQLAYP